MICTLVLSALTWGSVALAPDLATDSYQSIGMTAAVEAAYTLAAFFAVGLVIYIVQQRNDKNEQARKGARKARALDCTLSDDAAPLPRRPAVPSRSDQVAVTAAVRGGRASELPALLASQRAQAVARGLAGNSLAAAMGNLLEIALRACASRRRFREALAAYDEVSSAEGGVDICGNTWSVLLCCSVETRQFSRCPAIIEGLIETTMPTNNDFSNIVHFYAHQSDVEALKRTLGVLQEKGFVLTVIGRNRALSACIAQKASAMAEVLANDETMGSKMDVIGYNTLMKCYLECGQPAKCLEAYDSMRRQGESPSDVTFGVLLDVCDRTTDADRAADVFEELRASGIHMNVIHYTSLMKILAKVGRIDAANALLDEMSYSKVVKPDLVTYLAMVRANADHGKLDLAMGVIEKMREKGVAADNTVFHAVLSACITKGYESKYIMEIFNRLVSYGMKSTTTTLRLLQKALAEAQDWDEALDVLEHANERLSLNPEMRLFVQLAEACSNGGASVKVFDCYTAALRAATVRGKAIGEATSLRFVMLCSSDPKVACRAKKVHELVMASCANVALEALGRTLEL